MTLREFLDHPVSTLIGVLTGLSVVFDPVSAIFQTVYIHSGSIVAALTFASSQYGSLPSIPAGALQAAAFVIGAVYLAKLANPIIDTLSDKI